MSFAEVERLKRYQAMPDLSRTDGSPIKSIVDKIVSLPSFKGFDILETPEIVPTNIAFDIFNFELDHPARSQSDTYYVDETHILRTQTTTMWHYYTQDEKIKEKLANGESVGCLSYGKVYRKDEIDRHHMNIFHQMDGWYLTPKAKKIITAEDLKLVLTDMAKSVFGADIKYRFNPDTFPYTNDSLEMEIDKDGKWVEVLGCGVVKGEVLENIGVNPDVYNGWAFGFGLERLAIISMELPDIRLLWSDDERVKKQLILGNKFKEVSKFPPIVRDISFVVDKDFVLNDFFDLVRDIGRELIEEVHLLDKYENVTKFGEGKTSYTFRVTYRSLERTLTNAEINALHLELEVATTKTFKAVIRVV